MFCRKCGNELFDEAIICPNCGCETGIAPVKQQESSALGICAIIFSILGGWLGLILSIVGLCSDNEKDKSLSKIGLGICLAWVFILFLIIATTA